jgi:hypothetical protein
VVDEDDVRRLALALPDTTERPSSGTPAFRVRERPFARIHQDGGVRVLWCAHELEVPSLIEPEPEAFFTAPQYEGHLLVLVRRDAIAEERMAELLETAWYVRAPARLRRGLRGGGRLGLRAGPARWTPRGRPMYGRPPPGAARGWRGVG